MAGSALAVGLALVPTGCTAEDDPAAAPSSTGSSTGPSTGPATTALPSAGPTATAAPERRPPALSVPGLADQRLRGDRLRLGRVRERTSEFTSYDVSFRSRTTTREGRTRALAVSGVLNVPRGRGPFPAVVLAHGYIDPAIYRRGQGMTRERGFLAGRGYLALHVDYRNHAASQRDPRNDLAVRLGYTADVVNAVDALRRSSTVPVDDDRVALMGRSMGGGVVLKALVVRPGLVRAAVAWASVSSLEAENYRQFMAGDGDRRLPATPAQDPRLWRGLSARPFFSRISEPVLLVHGRADETCPPRWATSTQEALRRAGVDSRLAWFDDGHAFGPAFVAAMDRTVRFLDRRLGG